MRLESIGGGLQAVVHMPGVHLPRPALRTGQQQGGGIGPAAVAHRDGQGGRTGGERGHRLVYQGGSGRVDRGGA